MVHEYKFTQGAEPYSIHKATGMHLLNTISKGHYLDKDVYWAHAALSKEGKYIALVSLQYVSHTWPTDFCCNRKMKLWKRKICPSTKNLWIKFPISFCHHFRRIFLIEKRCLWGSWNVEWVLDINTLIKPPVVVEKKLILHVNKVMIYSINEFQNIRKLILYDNDADGKTVCVSRMKTYQIPRQQIGT